MKTFAFVNNKGGVSKTSSSANVGAYMSYIEKRVLLIDTDAQGNLTQHFNFYNVEKSLYDAYKDFKRMGKRASVPILQKSKNLYIIPASRKLADMERELVTYNNNQRVLQKLLEPLQEHFDLCIIDCPPSLGLLTDNAVVASDGVIIPIEASQFSLNGVEGIMEYLKNIRLHNDLTFDITGVFMAKFDERKSISTAVHEQVKKYFQDRMFKTVVRTNTEIEKAQANGEDIFVFAKNSNSAYDYGSLSNEILDRINLETETV